MIQELESGHDMAGPHCESTTLGPLTGQEGF